jgi:enoyl-CoA hydratase/carnithine racemase
VSPVTRAAGTPAAENRAGIGVSHGPDAIRVRLDRPPVNAFTVEMLGSFHAVMTAARDDPRPVLITGASGVFSAGFDIKHPTPDQSLADAAAQRGITAVQEHPRLTIAAVEGAAVGLGLLIATSADVLVLSKAARLRMPEVRLGIAADVQPLRRFLSDPWIRRLCLLGEMFTAEELHLAGAGVIVCEPGTAQDRAEQIIAAAQDISAIAVRRMKQQLNG